MNSPSALQEDGLDLASRIVAEITFAKKKIDLQRLLSQISEQGWQGFSGVQRHRSFSSVVGQPDRLLLFLRFAEIRRVFCAEWLSESPGADNPGHVPPGR